VEKSSSPAAATPGVRGLLAGATQEAVRRMSHNQASLLLRKQLKGERLFPLKVPPLLDSTVMCLCLVSRYFFHSFSPLGLAVFSPADFFFLVLLAFILLKLDMMLVMLCSHCFQHSIRRITHSCLLSGRL
jgi:hypothetical protein